MSKTKVVHRYKWTLEEKLILIIPSIALIWLTVNSSINKGEFEALWLLALVPWAGCIGLLVNISLSKKKKSTLTAEFDPETNTASVEGNKIYDASSNKGNLNKANNAFVKTVGVNETLVVGFEGKDTPNLYVPQRVASKQPFLDFLEEHIVKNDKVKKTAEVDTFFEGAKKWKK